MKIAYADPPYPGQAKRHYGDHPDYAGEVDHAELIAQLCADYPDGWALSTSSTCLRELLPMCPEDVRVGAWVKGFAVFHCNPAYAWEPVIFRGGRARRGHDRNEITVRDWVMAHPPCYRGKALGTRGQKPEEFCHWMFDLLGLRPDDEFCDLFPGTGEVARIWRAWSGREPEQLHEQAALPLETA
jgi:hypothetical protein